MSTLTHTNDIHHATTWLLRLYSDMTPSSNQCHLKVISRSNPSKTKKIHVFSTSGDFTTAWCVFNLGVCGTHASWKVSGTHSSSHFDDLTPWGVIPPWKTPRVNPSRWRWNHENIKLWNVESPNTDSRWTSAGGDMGWGCTLHRCDLEVTPRSSQGHIKVNAPKPRMF